MDYLLFCFEWWNKGGLVNYIILSSSFFVGLFFFNRRFSKNFTNIMIGVVPLLGLLGTVVGMIDTFNALQAAGADVQSLSAGISKAMITTSSGLCVAIFGTCILPLKPQEQKVNKKTPNNFVPREAPIMKEKTPNNFIAREAKSVDESFIPHTIESFIEAMNNGVYYIDYQI